jgi:hypothetical protein
MHHGLTRLRRRLRHVKFGRGDGLPKSLATV